MTAAPFGFGGGCCRFEAAVFQQFLAALQGPCRLAAGTRLVVACSGGADSMALLQLLALAAPALDLHLVVAHLDHGLRPESGEDARFVVAQADRLGLQCFVEREDVAGAAAGGNLEAVARRVRRSFLRRVAERTDCSRIALGHHRDDQAETVLFRILRGCGTTGLAAMAPCDPPFLRPLLGFSRDQLRAFLRDRQLAWREDRSNRDLARTRNRLRHQVLPLLSEIQSDAPGKLAELAARAGRDEDYWRQMVDDWTGFHVHSEADGAWLSLASLAQQHPALRQRIWLQLLRRYGGRDDYGEVHLIACERLLEAARPQLAVDLPGLWVARRYDRVLLRRQPPEIPGEWQIEVAAPGVYPLPGGRFLRLAYAEKGRSPGENEVEFSADQIRFPLWLRNRRPGDRFYPCGAPGQRKLKDYFIAARLSHEQRAGQALLVGDRILWVVGLRRCHGLVAEEGEKVLRCSLVRGLGGDKTA
ncbi:tRNA lysidine(34) synthetase TilS [Geothermobacter hydrogeniphilus]|uniref:tRNA(Ile)-lysidine synthase n=1 Tax=Geothermobacter hydrogeniphilus TaxID=1969733 RepID=A0A1X0YCV2_9BACT|nr:tRNA lysidine(34) synthetase TilS [Geothermobacter hydrogeniphilus]